MLAGLGLFPPPASRVGALAHFPSPSPAVAFPGDPEPAPSQSQGADRSLREEGDLTRTASRLIGATIAALTTLGCTPVGPNAPQPSPGPSSAPEPAPSAGTPAAADARSWEFRYTPGSRRYRVESEATVQLRSDSSRQEAPIHTTALVTVTTVPSTGDRLSLIATVDSFTMARGDAIPAPDSTAPIPSRATLRATISPSGQMEIFADPTAASCDPAEPLIAIARDLVVPLPPTLAAGGQWSDSTSTTICRGGTPVTTGIVRDYRVEGLEKVNGVSAVRIRRTDTFTLAGASMSNGQPVAISGRGAGSSILHFDPAAGAYLGGTTESEAELTVRAGRAESSFLQKVKRKVEATKR